MKGESFRKGERVEREERVKKTKPTEGSQLVNSGSLGTAPRLSLTAPSLPIGV